MKAYRAFLTGVVAHLIFHVQSVLKLVTIRKHDSWPFNSVAQLWLMVATYSILRVLVQNIKKTVVGVIV